MKNKPDIVFCGNSDVGLVRRNNEDAFILQNIWNKNIVLAVAIDGVGGYEGGEVAAAIAKKTIPEYLSVSGNGERIELLKQAVTAANNAIVDAKKTDIENSKMSCVLTAAIIDTEEKRVSMVHVGDTRLYKYHDGKLTKLSHDHSLVGYREEIGDLTEEEAMHHPQRNVIGRDVGSQPHNINDDDFIEAEVFPLEIGTTFLLCSDGLTDMVTSSTIKSILDGNVNLQSKNKGLIKAALDAGGKDNVTVVLVEYKGDKQSKGEKPSKENSDEVQMPDDDVDEIKVDVNTPSKKQHIYDWLTIVLVFIIGLLIGAYAMNYYNSHYKLNTKSCNIVPSATIKPADSIGETE